MIFWRALRIGSCQRLAKLSIEPNVCIGRDPIERVKYTKILGISYVEQACLRNNEKTTAGISALQRLRHFANRDILVSVYNALIIPHFDYCCEGWYSLGSALAVRLQKLHNRCARVIICLAKTRLDSLN